MEGEVMGFCCGTERVQWKWVRMSSVLQQRHPFTTTSCCWHTSHRLSRSRAACGLRWLLHAPLCTEFVDLCRLAMQELIWTQGSQGSKVMPPYSEAAVHSSLHLDTGLRPWLQWVSAGESTYWSPEQLLSLAFKNIPHGVLSLCQNLSFIFLYHFNMQFS